MRVVLLLQCSYSRAVRCSGLYGGSSLRSGSLQTHDDLELGTRGDITRGQLVEGGAGVYPDHGAQCGSRHIVFSELFIEVYNTLQ